MKSVFIVAMYLFGTVYAAAQTTVGVTRPSTLRGVHALIETEINFARMAEEKGTKAAFLANLSDDGIVFEPLEVNGKLAWKNRPESGALLSWNPAWADLSSDGNLGYTTGGWEFRAKGKTDKPTRFGDYLSIWQKQTDGSFKVLLDIGIEHPETSLTKAKAKFPADAGVGDKNLQPGVNDGTLTEIFSNKSLANGYFNFLADDVYILREGNKSFVGKQSAYIGLERADKDLPPSAFLNFTGAMSKIYGNLMFVSGVYQLTLKDKTVRKWSFVQIWKHRNGKWQVVADVFKPSPDVKPKALI